VAQVYAALQNHTHSHVVAAVDDVHDVPGLRVEAERLSGPPAIALHPDGAALIVGLVVVRARAERILVDAGGNVLYRHAAPDVFGDNGNRVEEIGPLLVEGLAEVEGQVGVVYGLYTLQPVPHGAVENGRFLGEIKGELHVFRGERLAI